MNFDVLIGLLIPFIGTTLGSFCVFFMKDKELNGKTQKTLSGFAAGVMVAASIWSLLIPSMEMSNKMGKFSRIPSAVGFMIGIIFLLILDNIIPHLHVDSKKPEGIKASFKKTTMLVLAVTLHNIPEGMAVGVSYAGFIEGFGNVTITSAFVLSIGIAIQNFPEGAIISMPLHSQGESKLKAFVNGTLSGAVEPVAAVLTILLTHILVPFLPYLLSFAAGAMMYVVVEELIPEATGEGESHTNLGTIGFSLGFCLMMILDVMLG
ncbi:MAG: ZIP family metal transporter [Peptoniphilaceae bacterium]|nr:ZIP family metal transporter [Peptoniphilaceae bacterium]MDD7383869.1 ZIP family metal transporter [Peptoniphilaceae bacterium]MDY3738010.1 ZIP family metal transporter [Peptoniphilaceae bacterium]